MTECVIFDMAGTTVEDDGGTVAQLLRKALITTKFDFNEDEINQHMGMKKEIAIRQLLNSRVEAIHEKFVGLCIKYYDTFAKEIEGASDLFMKIRSKGIKVALTTGFPRVIADTIINKLWWRNKIDISVTSDEVSFGRPYPDMINKVLEKLEITDRSKVIKVGDTFSDWQAATTAGVNFFGTSYGTHGESLKALKIPTIDSLSELSF